MSIHFPDGNKMSESRKSNQVSINSRQEQLDGLEAARTDIRMLTPLIYKFALPAQEFIKLSVESSTLRLKLQNEFNVQVDIAYNQDTTPLVACSVRGSEWDAPNVKAATFVLLQAFCPALASQMPVHMRIEISPQHQQFILGRNNEIIKKIMQETSTTITLPEVQDNDAPALNKASITISGSIENVNLARQNIVGCLPLVLMFDLMPDNVLDPAEKDQVMQALNVNIITKNKRQDGRTPVIIKAAEKNAANIYEAWKLLTKSDKDVPEAYIPPSYHMSDNSANINQWLVGSSCNSSNTSPLQSPASNPSSPHYNFPPVNSWNNVHSLQSSFSNPSDHLGGNYNQSRHQSIFANNNSPLVEDLNLARSERSLINNFNGLSLNGSLQRSSSSLASPHDINVSSDDGLNVSPQRSFTNTLSPVNTFGQDDSSVLSLNDRKAPGCERKRMELANQNRSNVDYLNKKSLAAKAMKEPVDNNIRVPNSSWSGYFFSKSTPGYMLQNQMREMNEASIFIILYKIHHYS